MQFSSVIGTTTPTTTASHLPDGLDKINYPTVAPDRLADLYWDLYAKRDRIEEIVDEDGIHYVTGDLATGEGIDPAVDGVGTIVHCAGGKKATMS